jgi:parallel beta-helix repeat protein
LLDGGGPPLPSGDVWVYVDGTGDYPTIEAAVADVDPGTTIHLGAGTFTLVHGLYVDFDLSLVGSGIDGAGSTTVRSGDSTVVEIYDAAFYGEDIRFVNTATSIASDVLVAEDADVVLSNCYFSGGNRYNNSAGDGLWFYGYTTAAVNDCIATLNDLNGIAVSGYANALLEGNDCSDNGQDGLGFWEAATGEAIGNTCNSNGYDGISASDYTEVTVEDNECSQNDDCGIAFYSYSIGEANGNTCDYNYYAGIYVGDYAYADLTGNACNYNDDCGIWFADSSDGTAQSNQCVGNKWGMYIDVDSYPYIGVNDLHGNTYNIEYEV